MSLLIVRSEARRPRRPEPRCAALSRGNRRIRRDMAGAASISWHVDRFRFRFYFMSLKCISNAYRMHIGASAPAAIASICSPVPRRAVTPQRRSESDTQPIPNMPRFSARSAEDFFLTCSCALDARPPQFTTDNCLRRRLDPGRTAVRQVTSAPPGSASCDFCPPARAVPPARLPPSLFTYGESYVRSLRSRNPRTRVRAARVRARVCT